MIAGHGVDVAALIPLAVERGVHLRTGLEDVPFGSAASNVDLVRDTVRRLRAAGAEPASAADVRSSLRTA